MISKMCSYVANNGCVQKKAKATKKCIIKKETKFKNYKKYLENNKAILRSQQTFRSKFHNVFIEKVGKITLSANDDKRSQTLGGVVTYPLTYALDNCVQKQNYGNTPK